MKKEIFLIFLILFAVSCKTDQQKKNYSICIENGTSRLEIRSEFAECYGISPEEIDDYELYKITETISVSLSETERVTILQKKVSSVIAGEILSKLKNAFGQNVEEYWNLERITIPVKYRSFRKTYDGKKDITVIGIIPKKEMTPRALIKYLPLEYKMQFIEKKEDKYYYKEDPMSDF